jgi:glycosyltransferase involved in cell wall biosynthesis
VPKPLDISVILPALSPSKDFARCIASIRASLEEKVSYEIICVVPDERRFQGFEASALRVCAERQPGIYGAMNTGIEEAKGQYLYFIGSDDVLLPGAATAFIECSRSQPAIVLGDVFWGEKKIFSNNARRKTLAWRNWCHQGIYYKRDFFVATAIAYPIKYKTQSDHYVNIVLSSAPNARIEKFDGCMAWYSASGCSTLIIDQEFRREFPKLVRAHFGVVDYLIAVVRRKLKKFFTGGLG